MSICICGEAWGSEEQRQGRPFVGATGWELNKLCEEAGLIPPGSVRAINRDRSARDAIYLNAGIRLTNVLNLQPQGNKIESLCGGKWTSTGPSSRPIRPGKYLLPDYRPELDRLHEEINAWAPNLILGLGATALWFFTGSTAITKSRGAISSTPYGKFLATYHPAYLFRDKWHERPTVILDMMKALRESKSPEFKRPQRFIYIPESVDDLEYAYRDIEGATYLSIDIETFEDVITCIGFAWSPHHALVIPIVDQRKEHSLYWNDNAWPTVFNYIERICSLPCGKVFQNGLYDLQFLYRRYGIRVRNCLHDTMLLHHALYPEIKKGLGFLASIYTDEVAWKLMRSRGKDTIKQEDE